MADITWAAAGMLVMLPATMNLEVTRTLEFATANSSDVERGHLCSWTSPDGRSIEIVWFGERRPPFGYRHHPITVRERWSTSFASGRATIVEVGAGYVDAGTLLAGQVIEPHGSFVHVVAKGMKADELKPILANARVAERPTLETIGCSVDRP